MQRSQGHLWALGKTGLTSAHNSPPHCTFHQEQSNDAITKRNFPPQRTHDVASRLGGMDAKYGRSATAGTELRHTSKLAS